jgi:hypothetical protein
MRSWWTAAEQRKKREEFNKTQDVRKQDPLPLDEAQKVSLENDRLLRTIVKSTKAYSYHALNFLDGVVNGNQATFTYQESLACPVYGIRLETVVIKYDAGITASNSFFYLEIDVGSTMWCSMLNGKPAKTFELIPNGFRGGTNDVVWENHADYWHTFPSAYHIRDITIGLRDENAQQVVAAANPWTYICVFSLLHCTTFE